MVGFTDTPPPLRTLWTDSPNAAEQLAARRADGLLTEAEAADLEHFIEHGWVLWRNAIEHEVIDAFVRDIRMSHQHPGMFVRTNHRRRGSSLVLSDERPDRFESLFDLYVNLPSSRAVCFHPRITRFLSRVFDGRVVAFQQLLFQRSNGHQLHQDTSVVAVQDPLLLAASWIALEDVMEGSGELAYYDRSHKLPHYLFKSGDKHLRPSEDDRERYIADLRDACERRGLEYRRFLARKGDVFIWAADLVHCSHPRRLPEDTSRLSCVTHYCPSTASPYWFRHHPDKRGIEPYDMVSAFASNLYRLPTEGRMLPPETERVERT